MARALRSAASTLAAVWLALAGVGARAEDPAKLSLGTATPGGGFTVYGAALAETVKEVDASLQLVARNTAGSAENIPLLEAGELDIALVQGEYLPRALRGGLKVLWAMYPTPGMFAVRADGPYRRIEDLKGRAVVFGARGSGLVLLARHVLEGLGLDPERDFEAIYVDRVADGPAMVLDGRAAALWGGGPGWPGFRALAQAPGGARFIAPDAAGIERIVARHPFLGRFGIAAGSYPGQDAAIESVGSWSFVLARATLSDDLAYRLVRALHRGEALSARRLAVARESTLANTAAQAGRQGWLHPAALRYLRENGVLQ